MNLVNQITTRQNNLLQQTQQNICQMSNELSSTQNELSSTIDELKCAKEEIDNVYRSKSWRITKPLRDIIAIFKK